MPIQYLAERTILNYGARSQKKVEVQEASIHWQHKAFYKGYLSIRYTIRSGF